MSQNNNNNGGVCTKSVFTQLSEMMSEEESGVKHARFGEANTVHMIERKTKNEFLDYKNLKKQIKINKTQIRKIKIEKK
jgi:hypothetical protein